jgi:hypothetical protein
MPIIFSQMWTTLWWERTKISELVESLTHPWKLLANQSSFNEEGHIYSMLGQMTI